MPESDIVRRVAENYRAWGYEVVVAPDASTLPPFLGTYRPDLLARRGDEQVLVEVKRHAGAEQVERYQELASRVHAHPGWRLDLVVQESPERSEVPNDLPVLPAEQIERLYQDAARLSTSGYEDAALLLSWAATEAALRLLAQRYAVPVQRSSTPVLLKQLVSLGVIGRDQYEQLRALYRARSAVAHGFALHRTDGSAASVISIGRQVLADSREAA